ncbi:carbohydrate ABC transporter permease [Paenibacillus herberti]|uniref:carbohydrate ABC transporter permease n=1 Tax=Paenibacillus herberti TaxID=1619309 RepID=UPI001C3DB557|nr:carbohydrate ABC transporter permease [Paenibacillus herberti]
MNSFLYVLLTAGGLVILVPFIWMLSTSLKIPSQVFAWPIEWIPKPVKFSNYVEALSMRPFILYYGNTFFITGLAVLGQVFSSSIVGYSLARLRWRGNNLVFALIMSTLMLPEIVRMIPTFVIFSKIGWVDTFLPLILPHFFAGAFNVFLFRQFFHSLPKDLDEAATVDGASLFGIYWRIILPLSKPVIGIVAINTFRYSWNDFLHPLIYLNDTKLWTITLGLRAFQQEFNIDWNLLMAASATSMLPILILFVIAQKYFIQGIVFTGVKG